MKDDLELKDLDSYIGSEHYYKVLTALVTDGVNYIMKNGYSWFVTDALIIIKTILKNEEFMTVDLKLNERKKTAYMIITNGNKRLLYKKHYFYTSAKRDLKLFYENNVLMLSGEY